MLSLQEKQRNLYLAPARRTAFTFWSFQPATLSPANFLLSHLSTIGGSSRLALRMALVASAHSQRYPPPDLSFGFQETCQKQDELGSGRGHCRHSTIAETRNDIESLFTASPGRFRSNGRTKTVKPNAGLSSCCGSRSLYWHLVERCWPLTSPQCGEVEPHPLSLRGCHLFSSKQIDLRRITTSAEALAQSSRCHLWKPV